MSDRKPSLIGTALAGGLVGSLLTAAIILFAAPQMAGPRIVRSALMAEPQILVDAADALRDRQYAPILATHRTALETPFGSSWKGARDADVTLVEFYDYACSYCRASRADIERLLKEDGKLRIVFRELPILGPESLSAARLSLAASKAGRFESFHENLWESGRPGPETLAQAAASAGIAAIVPEDPQIEAELRRNFEIAQQLGVTGTPMFVVGDRVMNGAVGYDALKAAISQARRAR